EPTATFADVPVNEWFYEDVEYVNDRGIMTGMGEDKTYFAP
ncbi:MAG TPA: S-layer homology domain-containing protein, partial [Firmicutes bacterium]|nr:S-layer homology domain-containing protein [Bacillota bacterium]